jgi:hypothetical protein
MLIVGNSGQGRAEIEAKGKAEQAQWRGRAPSSGEESDGLTALKAVEEEEGRVGVKRGPPSASRLHLHPPTKLTETDSKMLRWKFQYCNCNKDMLVSFFSMECSDTCVLGSSRTRTVKQPPGCNDFNDKKPQPRIGNLGTHTCTEHLNEYAGGVGSAQESLTNPINHGYTPSRAKLMEDFLEKG